MLRVGIYGVVLAANLAALFCVLNPWFEEWSGATSWMVRRAAP